VSIRVLVVDDSAVVRRVLGSELGRRPGLEVVGTASDPYRARDLIVRLRPDVVLLDIELPRMDGLTFLRQLMRYLPLPVIVVSSLTRRGGETAMEALAAGAVDVLCKPAAGDELAAMAGQLAEKIRAAAGAKLAPRVAAAAPPPVAVRVGTEPGRSPSVVAIGASTGGPQALEALLGSLPADAPPCLIVQHMPRGFTRAFADRLDGLCAVEVKEAESGDAVRAGRILIAPGDRHLVLARTAGGSMVAIVKDGPRIGGQRPSVDILFHSVARVAGRAAIGVLLTGMGDDGAEGLGMIRASGGRTLAQDEATCVVFGMPHQAIVRGAAERVVSIGRMPGEILACAGHAAAPAETAP